jgi:hypothetical protein
LSSTCTVISFSTSRPAKSPVQISEDRSTSILILISFILIEFEHLGRSQDEVLFNMIPDMK